MDWLLRHSESVPSLQKRTWQLSNEQSDHNSDIQLIRRICIDLPSKGMPRRIHSRSSISPLRTSSVFRVHDHAVPLKSTLIRPRELCHDSAKDRFSRVQ